MAKRGRPPGTSSTKKEQLKNITIAVRVSEELLAKIDQYMKDNLVFTYSDAIRKMCIETLKLEELKKKDDTKSELEFYTPPDNESFEDMKKNYIELRTMLDPKYSQEKVEFAQKLKNVGANFMYFYQALSPNNQAKLLTMLKPTTIHNILQRL